MTQPEQPEPGREPADQDLAQAPQPRAPQKEEPTEKAEPQESQESAESVETVKSTESLEPPEPPESQEHSEPSDSPRSAPEDEGLQDGRPGRRSRRRRLALRLGVVAVLLALAVAAFTVPVDKVIEAPGPTWNVLEEETADSSQDVLSVSGTQTYPTDGALRMTTVSVTGCPGYPVTTVNVIKAWFSSSETVLDREQICPKEVTEEEINAQNEAQMVSSQDAAAVAALVEAGLASSMTLTVSSVAEEQTSSDVKAEDVLVSLTPEGGKTTKITSFDQLREQMKTVPQGTKVTLEVLRGGKPTSTTLTTLPPAKGSEGSLLGLHLGITVDSDVKPEFRLSDIGGPSAGLMFALGIVDKVTPESLTGGKDIAGTGTISPNGEIGTIGGIQQKMAGARQAGASYFLAPEGNCGEVVGHEPDGMEVYAVSTLHEAVQVVKAIASGDTSGLSTCSASQKANG